jgi:protein-S-isoprenylcysteine O-methyltransferase Ste14
MSRDIEVCVLALYLPIAAAAALWLVRRPGARERAGMLLALAWNLTWLPAVNLLAAWLGWWRFDVAFGGFEGVPVELYLGWALLWGAVAPLALARLNLGVAVLAALGLDVLLMPLCSPVLRLGPLWLVGEAVALAACLLPALLLARWTAEDRRLELRASLQTMLAGGLVLFLLPSATFAQAGGGWQALLGRSFRWTAVLTQILAVAALPGVSAVQEFAVRGRGTPIPFDPPRRLVRSGIYRYVTNPMQLSAALVITGWGWVLHSGWLAAGGVVSIAYSAGLAAWDENADLEERFGRTWLEYRRAVRPWIPRLRPYFPADAAPARLYVASTCGMCSEVGSWLARRKPVGLAIVPAETHPWRSLRRVSYDPADGGPEEDGVAALGRALEHIGLGWALAGMAIRLPLVRSLAQLLVDASGGGPRQLAVHAEAGETCRTSAMA